MKACMMLQSSLIYIFSVRVSFKSISFRIPIQGAKLLKNKIIHSLTKYFYLQSIKKTADILMCLPTRLFFFSLHQHFLLDILSLMPLLALV